MASTTFMGLQEARRLARNFARNALDSTTYTTFQIDHAIRAAAGEAIRLGQLLPRVDTLTLTSGDDDLPTLPTGFRPDRLMQAYLSGSNVQVDVTTVDSPYTAVGQPVNTTLDSRTPELRRMAYNTLLTMAYGTVRTGQPAYLAFDAWTTGKVYPTPDQNYTINLRWNDFFTNWTAGQVVQATATASVSGGTITAISVTNPGSGYDWANPPEVVITGGGGSAGAATATVDTTNANPTGILSIAVTNAGSGYTSAPTVTLAGSADVSLNLPDDFLRMILMLGVPAFLQYNVPEQAFASAAGQQFMAWIDSVRGQGNLGDTEIVPHARMRW